MKAGLLAGGVAASPAPPPDWAWFDASNAGSITSSSGAVSQWDDLTGNGRHVTQGTGSIKPTTGSRTLNGENVLDFDGGDFLARTAAIGFSTAEYTIFMVIGSDADSSSYLRFMSFHNGSGNDYDTDNAIAITQGNTASTFQVFQVSSTGTTASGATPIGTWTIRKTTAVSAFQVIDPSGTTWVATSAGSGTANGGFVIGGGFESGVAGTNRFDGPIGEIQIFSSALSDADRDLVRNSLIAKWGA